MSNPNIKIHASKGGKARWMPKATHQGILNIMSKELPCVVLDNGVRLVSQDSVFKAFDRPRRGKRISRQTNIENMELPAFLESKNLYPLITEEDSARITPVKYLNSSGKECEGYRAEIIPIVCDIYLSARNKGILTPSQLRIAEISELLVRSLSQVGIIALIDEATGYQYSRPRDALQEYLNKMLQTELASWTKRFPDDFYKNIYTIRNWAWHGGNKNHYSCVGMYTNDLVYSRIAPGLREELSQRSPKNEKGVRTERFHQWLNLDVGHPLLSQHMHTIMAMQRIAIANDYGWKRFMELVDIALPKKTIDIEVDVILT